MDRGGDRGSDVNEHDEADEQEELYFVHEGRARFELDGESQRRFPTGGRAGMTGPRRPRARRSGR